MSAETTVLSPAEEAQFQAWARANGIADVNDPRAQYDYRGYWKATAGAPHTAGEHFPDTFKQHGHPTFSVESQYSTGANDGGRWLEGDRYVPAGADLLDTSRGPRSTALAEAVKALMAGMHRDR